MNGRLGSGCSITELSNLAYIISCKHRPGDEKRKRELVQRRKPRHSLRVLRRIGVHPLADVVDALLFLRQLRRVRWEDCEILKRTSISVSSRSALNATISPMMSGPELTDPHRTLHAMLEAV